MLYYIMLYFIVLSYILYMPHCPGLKPNASRHGGSRPSSKETLRPKGFGVGGAGGGGVRVLDFSMTGRGVVGFRVPLRAPLKGSF